MARLVRVRLRLRLRLRVRVRARVRKVRARVRAGVRVATGSLAPPRNPASWISAARIIWFGRGDSERRRA